MLPLLLVLPFLFSVLAMAFSGVGRRTTSWLAGAVPLGGLAILAALTPAILDGEIIRWSVPWVPQLGLALSLRLDGYAWMFAGLVLGIGGLVVMYAHYYLGPGEKARRFFGYLLLFMGSMLGVVLAGSLLLTGVFGALTSTSSFLLIGFWNHREDAREGARMALTITAGGGLALMGGVIMLGHVVGSFDLDTVLASGAMVREHALYPWILLLVLAGVFTKSAQFP